MRTLAYITDHVLEEFKKNLPVDQDDRLVGIEQLVKMKRIGTRGQGSIDLVAALLIATQLIFSLCQFQKSPSLGTSVAVVVILLSFAVVMIGCFCGQRNPKRKHIDQAFRPKQRTTPLE